MALLTPADLSTPPISWLKADSLILSDNDLISNWVDSSGNTHGATSSSSDRPVYKTNILNGLPAVRWDGSKSMAVTELGTALSSLNTFSFFFIGKINDISGFPLLLTWPYSSTWQFINEIDVSGGAYWGPSGNGNHFLYSASISNGDTFLQSFVLNGPSTPNEYINGNLISAHGTTGSGITSTVAMTGDMRLGSYFAGTSFGWQGDMYEIITFNHALNTADRQLVEGYLAWKWGQQATLPSGHLYKNAAPANYSLDAQTGAYNFSGSSANLYYNRCLGCSSGTYTFSGSSANLVPAGDDAMIICMDPGVGNVRYGSVYQINNVDLAGTLTLPLPPDVRAGILYGADGIEFTGQLIVNATSHKQIKGSRRVFYDFTMTDGEPIDLYYGVTRTTDTDTGLETTTKAKLSLKRVAISGLTSKYKLYAQSGSMYEVTDSIAAVDICELKNYVSNKEDYFVLNGIKYMIVTHELIEREGHIFVIRAVQEDPPKQELTINIRHFVPIGVTNDQS